MVRIGDFDVEVTFDQGQMFLAFVDGIDDFSVDIVASQALSLARLLVSAVEFQIEDRELLR